jgi:hypothetical protein
MVFRYLVLILIILFIGINPRKCDAQLVKVNCPLNYEQKFDDEKIIKSLNDACHESNLRTRDSYLKAIGILRVMLDTMNFPPLSLTDWKDSLLFALDNPDSPEKLDQPGSCCLPDNHCENISRKSCENLRGIWHEGVSCDADPCPHPAPKSGPATTPKPEPKPEPIPEPKPEPTPAPVPVVEPVVIKTGACILPDGSCMFLAENVCSTQHGVFKGEGVKCEEANPSPSVENTEPPKEIQPEVAPASPNPDPSEPQPMWACCPDNPDEECSNTTEGNCKNGRWLFWGEVRIRQLQRIAGRNC